MKEETKIKLRTLIIILPIYSITWLLYLLPAGTWRTPIPLLYFALQGLNTIVLTILIDPDLLKERLSKKPDAKSWDITFNRIYTLIGLSITPLAGLDVGVWKVSPSLPLAPKIVLLSLLAVGALIADRAVVVNSYFSRFVRIQKDRGHRVIDKGPYRFVRHPAYSAALLQLMVVPILLNSLLAYIPAGLCLVLMIWRTIKEDNTLQQELEGYRQYARRVKYRLIPGVF